MTSPTPVFQENSVNFIDSDYSWVENVLIKELKLGQFLMMGNASFHKSQRTKDLIESVRCKIIFLPPYLQDLNPIEKFWGNMKRWFRGKISEFTHLYHALLKFFNTQTST